MKSVPSPSGGRRSASCPVWYRTSTSAFVFVWVPLVLGYIMTCIAAYYVTEFHRTYGGGGGGGEPYALHAWNMSTINLLSALCLLPWVNMIAAPVLLTLVARLTYSQRKLNGVENDSDWNSIPTVVAPAQGDGGGANSEQN